MKKNLKRFLVLLSDSVPDVSFAVRFWDGDRLDFGAGPPEFFLALKNPGAAKSVLRNGELGFAEAYMAGNIDVAGDFSQLLRLGVQAENRVKQLSLRSKMEFLFRYARNLNFPGQAHRNISYHYDLGNDFYRLWLDDSMTYSCAYFQHQGDSLEKAQRQKYDYICRKLQLAPGETLVDIGCGWGGMLLHAAKHYGVKGVGCTLSKPQVELAQQRVKEAGLQNQVAIHHMDYRSLSGRFDKLVSIGMFEHVGRKFIPVFMRKVQSLLKPGGIGLLHTIGREKQSYVNLWTTKYIFPGGYLPSLDEIVRAMGKFDLVPNDVENLRLHYAMTLDKWCERFEAHCDAVRRMFDERFVRMWRLFLYGSAANFRYGKIRLYHVTFTHGLNNDLSITRDYLYRETRPTARDFTEK